MPKILTCELTGNNDVARSHISCIIKCGHALLNISCTMDKIRRYTIVWVECFSQVN